MTHIWRRGFDNRVVDVCTQDPERKVHGEELAGNICDIRRLRTQVEDNSREAKAAAGDTHRRGEDLITGSLTFASIITGVSENRFPKQGPFSAPAARSS